MQCSMRSYLWRLRSPVLLRNGCYRPRPSQFRSKFGRPNATRGFSSEVLKTILIPPVVFGGLLITLWTYKCMMMVVFQNKIIYMPSMPPFSRSETVEEYANECRPIEWIEHGIRSVDGTSIKLLEGSTSSNSSENHDKHVVILYFQGNASSLPPRLPYLSRILKTTMDKAEGTDAIKYTIVALSYRGFWKSKGSPTQPGIELDAEAAIEWVLDRYQSSSTRIILWGQSIGAGAASVSLANLATGSDGPSKLPRISGLLLETPFIDVRSMLIALYPQKFLPYRYLSPFLRSTWDSKTALTVVGDMKPNLKVLMLQAGDDELVPADNAPLLEQVCQEKGLDVERIIVKGALHTEVMAKPSGRALIVKFIKSFSKDLN